MNKMHKFLCPVCNEHKAEIQNDAIGDAEVARDFPAVPKENLVRVCESCYSMIKEEFSENGNTLH